MREYRYRVDREGRVFHDGTEIVDPATLRFFLLALCARGHHGERAPWCPGSVMVKLFARPEYVEAHRAGDWSRRRLRAR